MTNKVRGEVPFTIEGKEYTLCLTLGALAEIEGGLGVESIVKIGERLQQPSVTDFAMILRALLRGGGHDIEDAEVMKWHVRFNEMAEKVTEAFAAAGYAEEGNRPAPRRKSTRRGAATSKSA